MNAIQIEVSDGTLENINVGIEYFEQDDIQLFLDLATTPLVQGVDYQWNSATVIHFLTGPVPNGVTVYLRRATEIDEVLNTYDGGAPFSRITLDENFEQMLFLAQEVREGVGLDGFNRPVDMHGFRITNLGDPVDPADAANKRYIDQELSDLVLAGQGPTNVAGNVLYSKVGGGIGTLQEFTDSVTGSSGASVIPYRGRDVQARLDDLGVDIRQYGGRDDYNGVTPITNTYTAILAIMAAFPNGCRIRFPKIGTGVYYTSGSSGSSDMSKYTFDLDPDVTFHHVGTNTVMIGPGLVVTRATRVYLANYGYYFYLSPVSYGQMSGKPYNLSSCDGESPIVERIITSAARAITFKTVNPSTGATADTTATNTGDTSSFLATGTTYTAGIVPVRPGQEVHAQITLPSNTGRLGAFVQTEDGWVMFHMPNGAAGGALQRQVFITGFPVQTVGVTNFFASNPAYVFEQSDICIKVHGPRSFSLLINHAEVARMDAQNLTSDIIGAGWVGGLVTAPANPLFISQPSLVRRNSTYGMRPLRLVTVGDSTMDKANPFSVVNHLRRVASGVGGLQFSTILNQAIAGQTALQQRDLVNATDYAALGGFDYMLVDVGINDIGGSTPVASFVQAIVDIINRCATFNIVPIIGLPAMFYDQSAAAPYGQTGAGSANANRGAPYRLTLLRKLAELDVQVAMLPLESMGAALPSMLANPDLNPVWQDNVHQSNWGGELKGAGWAKALIGYMFNRVRKDIPQRTINAQWVPTAQQATYGNLVKPTFSIRGDLFQLGDVINIPASPPLGTAMFKLPQAYAPERQIIAYIPAGPSNGTWTLQACVRIDQDGTVYTQTAVSTVLYLNFSSLSWVLKD